MPYHGASGFNAEPDGPNFIITANNGFRAWRMLDVETGTLTSLIRQHVWTPGKQTCNCGSDEPPVSMWLWGHHVLPVTSTDCEYPTKDCSHGFYAYYDEAYYRDVINVREPIVNGLMEGWGRCVIGPKGFRSQYATISAFVEPFELPDEWLANSGYYEQEARDLIRAGLEKAYPTVPKARSPASPNPGTRYPISFKHRSTDTQ